MNILAAATTGVNFWETSIGSILRTLMFCIGILVVLFAAVKSLGKFTSGKPSEGVKIIFGTLAIAAILFQPALINDIIGFFSSIVSALIGSANQVTNEVTTTVVTSTPG